MNARGERTVRKIRPSTEPQWKIKFKSELPGSSNKNQREGERWRERMKVVI